MKVTTLPIIFSSILVVFGLMLPAAAEEATLETITASDIDKTEITLNPADKISLIVYTNGDLGSETKAVSAVIAEFRGRDDFNFVRVIDFKGGEDEIVADLVTEIQKELDAELPTIVDAYKANGSSLDPRKDMKVITDNKGDLLTKLGWTERYEECRAIIVGKDGQVIERLDTIDNEALPGKIKTALGI